MLVSAKNSDLITPPSFESSIVAVRQ